MNCKRESNDVAGFPRKTAKAEVFPITAHARMRLETRWPPTILPFGGFDDVIVPTDAPLVGYDGSSGASYVKVPGTPMVAIVSGGVVASFLSADSARARIALSGYGPEDFLVKRRDG